MSMTETLLFAREKCVFTSRNIWNNLFLKTILCKIISLYVLQSLYNYIMVWKAFVDQFFLKTFWCLFIQLTALRWVESLVDSNGQSLERR